MNIFRHLYCLVILIVNYRYYNKNHNTAAKKTNTKPKDLQKIRTIQTDPIYKDREDELLLLLLLLLLESEEEDVEDEEELELLESEDELLQESLQQFPFDFLQGRLLQ